MAKLTLNDINGMYASVVGLNNRFQQIEDALNNQVLYRTNPVGEPNEVNNNIDMNGYTFLNLPEPVNPSDPVRLTDIENLDITVDLNLSELADVDGDMTPADSQVLGWSVANDQWEALTIPGVSAIGLADLSDVNPSISPTNGQVLTYNTISGQWEAATGSGGGGGKAKFASSLTVTVGPIGTYATVELALRGLLDTYYGPEVGDASASPPRATIQLATGEVWDQQISLDNVDASWITISSVDSSVTVDTTGWSGTILDYAIRLTDAKSPIININFVGATAPARPTYLISATRSELTLGTSFGCYGLSGVIVGDYSKIAFLGSSALNTKGVLGALSVSQCEVKFTTLTMECSFTPQTFGIYAYRSRFYGDTLTFSYPFQVGIGSQVVFDADGSDFFVGSILTSGTTYGDIEVKSGSRVTCSVFTASLSFGQLAVYSQSYFHVGNSLSLTDPESFVGTLFVSGSTVSANNITVNGGGITVDTGDVRAIGNLTSYTTYSNIPGASDLLVTDGSFVRVGGTLTATLPFATNTVTANGIIFA